MDSNKSPSTAGGAVANGADEAADSLYEKKWNAAFARLKAFKAKFGHCRVPNRYAEDPQLGNWVSTQRRQYRILTTGLNKTVPLTQERAKQLIDLGFEWCAKDPSHKCWEDRFQELCDYKKKYGSTLVPMGWKENPRLATWVSTQRQEYKQLKLGHSSRLNEAKVKLLDDVGFVWEAQRGRRKLPHPTNDRQAVLPSATESKEPNTSAEADYGTQSRLPPHGAVGAADGRAELMDLLMQNARLLGTPSVASYPELAVAPSVQTPLQSRTLPSAIGNDQDLRTLIQQLQGGQPQPPPTLGIGSASLSSILQRATATQPQASQASGQAALLAALAGTNSTQAGGNNISLQLQELFAQDLAQRASSKPSAGEQQAVLQPAAGPVKHPAQDTEPEGDNPELWQDDHEQEGMLDSLLQKGGRPPTQKADKGKDKPKKKPMLSSVSATERATAAPVQTSAGVKRRLDYLVGQTTELGHSQQEPKSFPAARGPAKDSVTKQAPVSTLGSSVPDDLPESQALAVVRIYAASLPANSRSRTALLAAQSVAEAENILRADILRPLLQPQRSSLTLPSGVLRAEEKPKSQSLDSLQALLSGNSQAFASQSKSLPTATTLEPKLSNPALENLKALISGNAQASTSQAASLPSATSTESRPTKQPALDSLQALLGGNLQTFGAQSASLPSAPSVPLPLGGLSLPSESRNLGGGSSFSDLFAQLLASSAGEANSMPPAKRNRTKDP